MKREGVFMQKERSHQRVMVAWFLCLVLCLTVLLPCISATAETTKVTAHLLRLRAQPSAKARVIDAYPKGTEVTILKKGSEWTKVKVKGKTGYMQTRYLSYAKNQSSGSGNTGGSTMYVKKGVWLYLRAEPDSNSEILSTVKGGTAVTVLKKGKYWTRVSVKGLEGYMGNDYLSSQKE